MKQALYDSDMQFFESLISTYSDELSIPLIQRRQEMHRDDPIEELQDMYGEMKEQEGKFRKVIEICSK